MCMRICVCNVMVMCIILLLIVHMNYRYYHEQHVCAVSPTMVTFYIFSSDIHFYILMILMILKTD